MSEAPGGSLRALGLRLLAQLRSRRGTFGEAARLASEALEVAGAELALTVGLRWTWSSITRAWLTFLEPCPMPTPRWPGQWRWATKLSKPRRWRCKQCSGSLWGRGWPTKIWPAPLPSRTRCGPRFCCFGLVLLLPLSTCGPDEQEKRLKASTLYEPRRWNLDATAMSRSCTCTWCGPTSGAAMWPGALEEAGRGSPNSPTPRRPHGQRPRPQRQCFGFGLCRRRSRR